MVENEKKLAELRRRVEDIARYQDYFVREMTEIRRLIAAIETDQNPPTPTTEVVPVSESEVRVAEIRVPETPKLAPPSIATPPLRPMPASDVEVPANMFSGVGDTVPRHTDLEKFIGENLIAKIGVVITVIGVAIGAKFAIDQGWITPVMRVVFGYLIGIGLLVPAYRLRQKYEAFSAVTLSGAMAVFYFMTYAAYAFYGLVPQTAAFAMMVVFTAFTVLAAIRYNRVVIAHFGLAGAYAVPFLLSENEGRVAILFTYMAIINAGIMTVSIVRYWRSLFYSSFAITWLIYFAWYVGAYNVHDHFGIAIGFSTVFFILFYVTFIAWKLIAREPFGPENVVLTLANSFIYFGFGYATLAGHELFKSYLGPFAVANAAVHFAFAVAVHRSARVPRSIVNLLVGLILVFLTIAVPIQLEGSWITLIWIAEATILFVIGRIKKIALYEWFAYPLMLLASGSLVVDWILDAFRYQSRAPVPVFNDGFVANAFYVAGGAAILIVGSRWAEFSVLPETLRRTARVLVGAAVAFVVWNGLRMEISNYWLGQRIATAIQTGSGMPYSSPTTDYDPAISYWNAISQIDFSLLLLAAAMFVNRRFLRSQSAAIAFVLLAGLFLFIFITVGFSMLEELRFLYLAPSDLFRTGTAAIAVRYVSYFCAGLLLFALWRSARDESLPQVPTGTVRTVGFGAVLNIVLLASLSSELLNIAALTGTADGQKLGMSILWGVYALILIGFGIARNRKFLRVGALVLFGVTLIKVIFYDLAELGTIARTVVFVSLGLLLLIAGYFYNRFAARIFKTDES